MLDFFSTIVFFVIALAILVAVHELGHFWVARRLGVKVLQFSIGFGRPLLRWVGGPDRTEYVIAGIPLGGFVKMLDEREGDVDTAERHRAFNRQGLWTRVAIVAAGPVFNFLFAIVVYWGILVVGDSGTRALIGTVAADSIAADAGLAAGDELIEVDGRRTPTWESAVFALMAEALDGEDLPLLVRDPNGAERVTVLDGVDLSTLPDDPAILSNLGLTVARPVLLPILGEVMAGEPAEQAGLQPGDRVLTSDGEPVESWKSWVEMVQAHPGETMSVRIARADRELVVMVTPRSAPGPDGDIGRIGAAVEVPDELFAEYRTVIRLGPIDAIGAAVIRTVDMAALMLRVIWRMLTGQASVDNLSGPIAIAETAGKTASYGADYYLKFLAIVSISLGVLNLLPVPVLDGGHLLYFAIEAVKGSPLSEQAQMHGQRIGIALIAGLMTLAFYVDISRLLG